VNPAWLLAVALGGEQPRILSVGSERLDGRPAVSVVSAGPLREVGLARDGAYLVLSVRADAPAHLPALQALLPLQSIRLERTPASLSVRIGVAPEVPFEVRRQEATLTILFGEADHRAGMAALVSAPALLHPRPAAGSPETALREPLPAPSAVPTPVATATPRPTPTPAPSAVPTPVAAATPRPAPTPTPSAAPTPAPPSLAAAAAALFPAPSQPPVSGESEEASDLRSLYARIFPSPASLPPELEKKALPMADKPAEDDRAGLALGPLRMRPQGDLVYVDAQATLETATPVRDDYFELRPRMAFDTPLGPAQLEASYEARVRNGSAFAVVGSTTHLANAALVLPVRLLQARADAHYARGVLETTEVDPGREYFFKLGRFTHQSLDLGLRTFTGSRLDLQGSLGLDAVDLVDEAGFISHQTQRATAGLRYELTPNAHGSLVYAYKRVSRPEARPQAASHAQGGLLTVEGELASLLNLAVSLGYKIQRNPEAGEGGRSYGGFTVDGRIRKEFSRASSLTLTMSRDTQISAFEENGFYVSSAARVEVGLPLPFSLAVRGGVEYRSNDYRTPAAEIGEPRADHLLGWTMGLGRPLTRWSYVRADYRRDRRRSNLSRLDTDLDGFTIQVGFGVYGEHRP